VTRPFAAATFAVVCILLVRAETARTQTSTLAPPGDAALPVPAPMLEPVPDGAASIPFGPPDSLAPPPPPRPPLPEVLAFGAGELLEFSIDYGIVNAGGATMEVGPVRRVGGRPCFDIRSEAKSNSVFSKVYKVWDRSQTYLDVETLLPLRYEKRQREGSFKKDVVIKFDRRRDVATYADGEEVKIHPYAQDELSAFYYMRTFPIAVGQDVFIESHTGHKNYPLKVIVHRRENVTVPAGTFDCWVIEPVIREGGIFTAKGKLTIWITADERRMPVLMQTKIVVGSISASLVKYREGDRGPRISRAQSDR
jgi:hypothetical protein